ncbi:PhnD/SsuA/transferrin family substrate-binding protein [Methylopila sp. M107]|uniref:phosphate/phosphite/phosphonate ABC transporter substrate-binding protein n=1 Tax=Methylopila sp. M107 TaxID=1101190 RepID=UPI00036FB069|nr:PhnD/SsuA/transferrin family substrate-binding protein [Methylopila sp. M107]
MSGLASLPMYDAPKEALADFWAAISERLARAGFEAPDRLSEPSDLDAHWRDPDLLLSQTCGLPLSTELLDKVDVVGTPHYAALGCAGPDYRSLILVRTEDEARRPADLRGRRAAINDFGSHSGSSQLFSVVAPFAHPSGFFDGFVISGSHAGSIELVRAGVADVASVDCVTFALAARDRPFSVRGLRVIGRSPPSPGLPFITAKGGPPERLAALRAAILAALRDPELAAARAELLIHGFSPLSAEAYAEFPKAAFAGVSTPAAVQPIEMERLLPC